MFYFLFNFLFLHLSSREQNSYSNFKDSQFSFLVSKWWDWYFKIWNLMFCKFKSGSRQYRFSFPSNIYPLSLTYNVILWKRKIRKGIQDQRYNLKQEVMFCPKEHIIVKRKLQYSSKDPKFLFIIFRRRQQVKKKKNKKRNIYIL